MRHRMRIAATGGSLALVVAVGCGSAGSEKKIEAARQAAAEQAILVNASDVTTAVRRRLESGISFTGELKPTDEVRMTAHFDGDLQSVFVREGTRVRKGQSMAVYNPRDVRNLKSAAEAGLLAAKSALVSAQNAERRARKLLEAGAAAPSDLEAAEAARTAAEAQVRASMAQSELADDNADRLAVPAPIPGWVSQVFVHTGDRTAKNDPLFTVVRTDTLELSATIPSETLGRVRRGTPIIIRVDAFPGESFGGVVDRINPATEPGTRQIRIYTRVLNADGRLVGGLFASGRVIDQTRDDAVTAPVSVLRREGADQVVYRLQGSVASRAVVQTGLLDEEQGITELIGAVEPGDSLLSGVVPGLRDGARVRVIKGNDARGQAPLETPAGNAADRPTGNPAARTADSR
jgi:membrane fusion protein, multidrug efflux system